MHTAYTQKYNVETLVDCNANDIHAQASPQSSCNDKLVIHQNNGI